MSIENLWKLRRIVYIMMALGVITFLSGFLKYTPFEHITVLLFFVLFFFGMKLFKGIRNSEIKSSSKFFIILTGLSSVGFFLLLVVAIAKTLTSGLTLSDNLELLEGLFYLTSLIFLIGTIGSAILLNINRGPNSIQS
jgi:hypothetical protein